MHRLRTIAIAIITLLLIVGVWRWDVLSHLRLLIGMILMASAGGILFSTFREEEATGKYASAFALYGTALLLVPEWSPLLILMLIGGLIMQSMNLRSFMAAIVGLLVPAWILAGVFFLIDKNEMTLDMLSRLWRFDAIRYSNLNITQWVCLLPAVVGGIPAILRYPVLSFELRTNSRARYLFLLVFYFGTLVYLALQPTRFESLAPLLLVTAASFFDIHTERQHNGPMLFILLILFTLLIAACLTLPIWMP